MYSSFAQRELFEVKSKEVKNFVFHTLEKSLNHIRNYPRGQTKVNQEKILIVFMRFEAMIFQGTLEGILEHISQWKLSLSLSYSLTYIRESLSFMYKVLQVKWVPP